MENIIAYRWGQHGGQTGGFKEEFLFCCGGTREPEEVSEINDTAFRKNKTIKTWTNKKKGVLFAGLGWVFDFPAAEQGWSGSSAAQSLLVWWNKHLSCARRDSRGALEPICETRSLHLSLGTAHNWDRSCWPSKHWGNVSVNFTWGSAIVRFYQTNMGQFYPGCKTMHNFCPLTKTGAQFAFFSTISALTVEKQIIVGIFTGF